MTAETTTTVDLYEDNAGTLYLSCGNRIAVVPAITDGMYFPIDAAGFARQDTAGWEGIEIVETSDAEAFMEGAQARHVATWEDRRTTIVDDEYGTPRWAGSHARRYLGIA